MSLDFDQAVGDPANDNKYTVAIGTTQDKFGTRKFQANRTEGEQRFIIFENTKTIQPFGCRCKENRAPFELGLPLFRNYYKDPSCCIKLKFNKKYDHKLDIYHDSFLINLSNNAFNSIQDKVLMTSYDNETPLVPDCTTMVITSKNDIFCYIHYLTVGLSPLKDQNNCSLWKIEQIMSFQQMLKAEIQHRQAKDHIITILSPVEEMLKDFNSSIQGYFHHSTQFDIQFPKDKGFYELSLLQMMKDVYTLTPDEVKAAADVSFNEIPTTSTNNTQYDDGETHYNEDSSLKKVKKGEQKEDGDKDKNKKTNEVQESKETKPNHAENKPKETKQTNKGGQKHRKQTEDENSEDEDEEHGKRKTTKDSRTHKYSERKKKDDTSEESEEDAKSKKKRTLKKVSDNARSETEGEGEEGDEEKERERYKKERKKPKTKGTSKGTPKGTPTKVKLIRNKRDNENYDDDVGSNDEEEGEEHSKPNPSPKKGNKPPEKPPAVKKEDQEHPPTEERKDTNNSGKRPAEQELDDRTNKKTHPQKVYEKMLLTASKEDRRKRLDEIIPKLEASERFRNSSYLRGMVDICKRIYEHKETMLQNDLRSIMRKANEELNKIPIKPAPSPAKNADAIVAEVGDALKRYSEAMNANFIQIEQQTEDILKRTQNIKQKVGEKLLEVKRLVDSDSS